MAALLAESVTKWQLFCATEGIIVQGWSEERPVCCFNSVTHTIKPVTVHPIGSISAREMTLKVEESRTGGNYKCDCFTIENIAAGQTGTINVEFPFPVNLVKSWFVADAENKGDVANVYFTPDIIIGAITSHTGPSAARHVYVSPNIINNFIRGQNVLIYDNVNQNNLGTITAVDRINNRVTVTSVPTKPFSSGSSIDVTFTPIAGTLTGPLCTTKQLHVSQETIAGALVGMSVSCESDNFGTITAIDATHAILSMISVGTSTHATGATVNLSFPSISTSATVAAETGDIMITVANMTGIVVGLVVEHGGVSIGSVADISGSTITLLSAISTTIAIDDSITFSQASYAGALASEYNHTTCRVKTSLASSASLGLTVTVDGANLGSITDIDGDWFTVTGNIPASMMASGVMATLSTPAFTTTTLQELDPPYILDVTDTVTEYAFKGVNVRVTDGSFVDDLGRVVDLDRANTRMRVERPSSREYGPGAYIQICKYYIENLRIGGPGIYSFKDTPILGAYIDVGRTGCITYKNNGSVTKSFSFYLEYLY